MKQCPNCGNQVADKAVFCDQCGSRLPVPEPVVEPVVEAEAVDAEPSGGIPDGIVLCASCGAENVPGEVFCDVCGEPLETPEPAEPIEAIVEPEIQEVVEPAVEAEFVVEEVIVEEEVPVEAAVEEEAVVEAVVEEDIVVVEAAVEGAPVAEALVEEAAVVEAVVEEAPAAAQVFCPVCGSPIHADDTFCGSCGAAIASVAAEPVEEAPILEEVPIIEEIVEAPVVEIVEEVVEAAVPAAPVVEEVVVEPVVEEVVVEPVIEEVVVEAAPKCPSCGEDIEVGQKFCANCGAILQAEPVVVEPVVEAEVVVEPEAVAPAASGPYLEIAASGAHIPLVAQPELLVGRRDEVSGIEPEVDMTPHGGLDGGISRRHAKFYFDGAEWSLSDLDSTNGTYVNGKELSPKSAVPLKSGDKLEFGEIELVFHA